MAWAFSLSNAGARYTRFGNQFADLAKIDWEAVISTDFRSAEVKEGKQAEFLVHTRFPWTLVTRIGVQSMGIRARAQAAIAGSGHQPPVQLLPNWYF